MRFFIFLMISILFISCSDSNSNNSGCKAICSGEQIRECNDGSLSTAHDCSDNKTCKDGVCIAKKDEECTQNDCLNGQFRECKDGKYLKPVDCGELKVCEDRECKELVVDSSCVYNSCTIDAKMKVICSAGKKEKPIACENDEKCLFGKCTELPKNGDLCDESKFTLRCLDDNTVLNCVNSKVEETNCEIFTELKGSKCQIQGDLGVGACVEDKEEGYQKSSCNGNILYEWSEYHYAMIASECKGEFNQCVEMPLGAKCTKSCDVNSPVVCSSNNKPMSCIKDKNGSSYMSESSSSSACINNKIYSCRADIGGVKLIEQSCDTGTCMMSSNPMTLAQAQGKFVCRMEDSSCEYGKSRCSSNGSVEICTGKAWERIPCGDTSCVMINDIGAMCSKEVEEGNTGIGCEGVPYILDDGTLFHNTTRFFEYIENNGKFYEIIAGYGNKLCYQGGIYECINGEAKQSKQCDSGKICNPMSDLSKDFNFTKCVDSCEKAGELDCSSKNIMRCENIQGQKILVPSFSSDFHSTLTNAICDGDGSKIYTCNDTQLKTIACNNFNCNEGMSDNNGNISCSDSCIDGESFCEGEQVKKCENGFWVSKSLCVGDKTCVKYGGKAQCSETCDKSIHGDKAICNGDNFIQCITLDGKNVWSNFSSRCNENKLETCAVGNLISTKCEDNYSCHKGRCQAPKCKSEFKTCIEDGKYHAKCKNGDYIVKTCEYVDGKSKAMCHDNAGCYTQCIPSNVTSLGQCVQYNSAIEFCNDKGEVEKKICTGGKSCNDSNLNEPGDSQEAFCF